jgi:hypothetical protein
MSLIERHKCLNCQSFVDSLTVSNTVRVLLQELHNDEMCH